jgi:prepilin-type processing-associated H-X9-DG protein
VILAAILFPVFARARENARRASCQSNLKQIGLGLMQYTQDYDEVNAPDWNDVNCWAYLIQPYVKSDQLFVCPSASDQKPKSNSPGWDNTSSGGYSINAAYGGADDNYNPPASISWASNRSLAQIVAPASTVWVMDSDGSPWFFWEGVGDQPSGIDTTTTPRSLGIAGDGLAQERHLERTNVLWCDGHVKSVKLDLLNERSGPDNTLKYLTIEDD